MPTLRLPLAEQFETRDASGTKDEVLINCFVDGSPQHKYIMKRFGTIPVTIGPPAIPASQGQGMFAIGANNYAINGDKVYSIPGGTQYTISPPPSTLNEPYQSITQSDNSKAVFKTTKAAYIFDNTSVVPIPSSGSVSSVTITNNGTGGTPNAVVPATALVNGTTYMVTSQGTTPSAQWISAGAVKGGVAGEYFTATATTPTTGTGTAAATPYALTFSGGNGTGAAGYFIVGSTTDVINAGFFHVGTAYTIATLGTTNFMSIGAASNTVGLVFTATGIGTGTGTATLANSMSFTQRTLPASSSWSAIGFGTNTVTAGSFVIGRTYTIATIGTTDFTLIGAASNTVGIIFTATGVGTGTGTATFGRFVALTNTSVAATSDDGGVTWTARTITANRWSSIAWSPTLNLFCAVGFDSPYLVTSPDGITWTAQTIPSLATYGNPNDIVWNGSVFCVSFVLALMSGMYHIAVITSSDGVAWNLHWVYSSDQGNCQWWYLATGGANGKNLVTFFHNYSGGQGGSRVSVSTDNGVTWTNSFFQSQAFWIAMAWNPTLNIYCVIAQDSSKCATSPDGITWTEHDMGISTHWVDLVWNGKLFCAISSLAGLAATSTDGITWTKTAEATTDTWSAIAANTATGLVVGVAKGTQNAMTGTTSTASGSVTNITITTVGSGYTSAPFVDFSTCPNLTGATGTVNISSYPVTTVPGIAYLDGTYYVMEAGTNRIYNSGTTSNVLDAPTYWNPLSYVTANAISGAGVALARYHNYIVAFKSESIEFFYDAGLPLPASPLAAVNNAMSRVGCASPVIVPIDNTIVFLSKSIQKGIQVSMLDGQGSVVVSTPDVDKVLNYTNILSDKIYAFSIKIQGHNFYVLTLKAAAITFAYDMVTKLWARWTYSTPATKSVTSLTSANGIATATVTAHGYSDNDAITIANASPAAYNGTFNITYVDANTFTYAITGTPASPATGTITSSGYPESYFPIASYLNNGTVDLLQNETDGEIYQAQPLTYQDQGYPIKVKLRTRPFDGGTVAKKHISKMEIIGDKVTSTAYLRYSDDDAQTWCGSRPVYLNQRSMLRRCGSTRRRIIEIMHSDNTPFRIESLELDIDKGSGE